MVSQADRELIQNFVTELQPYLETVDSGVDEFKHANPDGVVLGQSVQALSMVRGAGSVLMLDGLVSIADWMIEGFERVQENPDIEPDEARRLLLGLTTALKGYLQAISSQEDAGSILNRAQTIFESIPAPSGPAPGTVSIGGRDDLDRLFTPHTFRDRREQDDTGVSDSSIAGSDQPTDRIPSMSDRGADEDVPPDIERDPGVTTQQEDVVLQSESSAPIDPELRAIFIEEADALLLSFREHARKLTQDPADRDAVDGLRRDSHTLKGAANMTGFALIGKVSSSIENLMDAHLDFNEPASRGVLELLVVCWKMLRAMRGRLDDLEMFHSPADSVVRRAGLLEDRIVTSAGVDRPEGDRDDRILHVENASLEPAPEGVDLATDDAPVAEVEVLEEAAGAAVTDSESETETELVEDETLSPAEVDAGTDDEFWTPVEESDSLIDDEVQPYEAEESWSPEDEIVATVDTEPDAVVAEIESEPESPFWADHEAELVEEDIEAEIEPATTSEDEFFESVDESETSEPVAAESEPDSGWLIDKQPDIDAIPHEPLDETPAPESEPFWEAAAATLPAEDEIIPQSEADQSEPFFVPVVDTEFDEALVTGSDGELELDFDATPDEAGDDLVLDPAIPEQIETIDELDEADHVVESDLASAANLLTGEFWETPIQPAEESQPEQEYDFTLEMFETFALECVDYLDTLSRAAMELDRRPDAAAPMREVRRVLHTMKGAASAADFSEISARCHELEDKLSQSDFSDDLDTTFAGELFIAIDEIERLIERRRRELRGGDGDGDSRPADATTLRIDLGRVDNLLNTVGELVVTRSGLEQRLERLAATLDELSLSASRLQRSSYLLERETQSGDPLSNLIRGERLIGAITPVQGSDGDGWDTLEMERYTEFDRLIRQLSEVGADVGTAVTEVSAVRGDLDAISERQRRLTTHLQDELMDVRMVPIASVAPRLYRVVRHVANRRGKRVDLAVDGGETPFDKMLLEALSEPLLHLLRNAVDHGIELPDERRRIGKPATGKITIRASREGNEAIIEIRDDGAGIDHEVVLDAARSFGYDVPDEISRPDALRYLFLPGFSTRADADEVSGRGIGLDIVEQAISGVKGRMTVDSTLGTGTMFSLRLPLQLSVAQAFLVTAGQGRFAVPIANIEYVAEREEVTLTEFGDAVVVEVGDSTIPVVDIAERFGSSQIPIMGRESGWIMIAEVAGSRWALAVDDLEGQQEVVVKPLGRFLRDQRALMGATILGNGDVALIIDVAQMLDPGTSDVGEYPTMVQVADDETESPAMDAARRATAPTVLIVDDSLSVRRVVGRTLERHGWISKLARDGVEGLELAEQQAIDVIITDIEMPRMDGFELLTAIRANHHLNELPVIVLTSRSSEKHRSRAYELGANGYIVKPFQEQELIASVARFVRSAQTQQS